MPPPLPRFTAASSAAAARLPLHYRPEFSTATAADMAGSQEKQAAPQSQPPAGAGGVADRIMPHLLNMVKQIKSAFYTLPKVFGESKITEYTVQENPMGPGKTEVVIENKQQYKVLGKAVDLTTLIRLQVENGKVVKHEDWWDKKPLKNRDTVGLPLVGRLAEASRRGAMLLTHALMGFGKDPKPAQPPPPPPPPSQSSQH
ncbi:uncharacterized protein [Miscanthus floridulus]|uniref:uncharacterized protein isoform X2 n=1 Tax=Miscanthus floridulus TaxID=154761 RepID=UPI00345976A7